MVLVTLSHHDSTIHRRAIGDADSQQVWESLVVLVATRTWSSRWVGRKTTITAKSDNIVALSMLASLKSKVSSLLCREVAFEMCKSSFQPRFVEHIPGVFNFSPNSLSRRGDPHYAPSHIKLPGSLEVLLSHFAGASWLGGLASQYDIGQAIGDSSAFARPPVQ